MQRTIEGLVEYFNKRFQFYGRQLKLVIYDGKGDPLTEIIGQGQEGAKADALKVAKEYQAFADVSAVTAPYAAALAGRRRGQHRRAVRAPDWLASRRPYSWTPLTDCSTVVESAASYYAHQDGRRCGQERRWRAEGTNPDAWRSSRPTTPSTRAVFPTASDPAAGPGKAADLKAQHKYTISTNPGAAVNEIITKLKDDKITTVMCGCDPVFLNFLTTALNQQGLFPEMIVAGVALVDTDLVGQTHGPERVVQRVRHLLCRAHPGTGPEHRATAPTSRCAPTSPP